MATMIGFAGAPLSLIPGPGCPLGTDVRDDVQGQVPGVGFLAVRLDIGGAEESLHVRRVPALLYIPSAALKSPVKRSVPLFPERLLT